MRDGTVKLFIQVPKHLGQVFHGDAIRHSADVAPNFPYLGHLKYSESH